MLCNSMFYFGKLQAAPFEIDFIHNTVLTTKLHHLNFPHKVNLSRLIKKEEYNQRFEIKKVACGNSHTLFLMNGRVYAFGQGILGQLGCGEKVFHQGIPQRVDALKTEVIASISCGATSSAVVTSKCEMMVTEYGGVYVWGEAPKGALGESKEEQLFFNNQETEILKPRGMKVEALVSHEAYNSYIRKRRLSAERKKNNDSDDDGSDQFSNQVFEEIGEKRTEAAQSHEVKKMNTMVRTLEFQHFKSIKIGEKHSLFSIDGILFGMGVNKGGLLGVGHDDEIMNSTPVLNLEHSNVIDFIACQNHNVALTKDGHVYTWGDGGNGRIGLGLNTKSAGRIAKSTFIPLQVSIPHKVKKIAAGNNITLAMTKEGKLFQWGRFEFEKPKFGEIQYSSLPQDILPQTPIKMIACGNSHCMILSQNNEIFTWGNGQEGCLGLNDTRNRAKPTEMYHLQGKRITLMECGDRFSIIVTDETRGLEPAQKMNLKTILTLTQTKAVASRFLSKVRASILEKNQRLMSVRRSSRLDRKSIASSSLSIEGRRESALHLPPIRRNETQAPRMTGSTSQDLLKSSNDQKLELPSIKGKEEDVKSRVSSALSKSFDISRSKSQIEDKEENKGGRLDTQNDLINEETIKYFIEQNFLLGKRAHELPKYNPYKKKSGQEGITNPRLEALSLKNNLKTFGYPDFFTTNFKAKSIDPKFEALQVSDKAKVMDRIVNMIFDEEFDSPQKQIQRIKKKHEVSTAARTQGLAPPDQNDTQSPLLVEHNPYTLHLRNIGLSESTKKKKIDTRKMIKESNEELNRNVQSPEKLKRMAMKLNLQVMIKQLNDEDLE